MSPHPKLIVFDLDYTLWPFFVELHYLKPYRITEENIVVDHRNHHVKHYPDVPEILEKLSLMGIDLALASRTSEIEGANQLIDLFGWRKYFKYIEVYPTSKTKHFKEFKKLTDYEYHEMLFFDDEHRNIKDISAINVTCIHAEGGMTMDLLHHGLETYKKSK